MPHKHTSRIITINFSYIKRADDRTRVQYKLELFYCGYLLSIPEV